MRLAIPILVAAGVLSAATPDPVTREEMLGEATAKLARVRTFLKERRLGGILLTRVNNFSWVTAGLADNHIVITSEIGAASLLILDDGRRFVVASNSEMPRLLAEDLRGLGYVPLEFKWYEDKIAPDRKLALIRQAAGERRLGSDAPYADLPVVEAEFQPLRYELTETEIRKYRWLGREATEAVAAVCRRIQPGVTERDMEAMAGDELMRRGIRPMVLLMGADDRVLRFRHTVPSDRKLERYAMVNVCARKWGLVVSTCRFVHFGPVPEDLKRRVSVSAEMTARYLAASKPGAGAGAILDQARGWYKELGFDGELELHHQGGAIGYAEREWVAVPGSREIIHTRQAMAWNPIVQGTLSFDTFVIYPDHVENLDEIAGWPVIAVQVNGRPVRLPDTLVRPAETPVGRLANGAEVVAVRSASGEWGLAARGAEPELSLPRPAVIEIFTESGGTRTIAAGYSQFRQAGNRWIGHATLRDGAAAFLFEDAWQVAGPALRLSRQVKVTGRAEGGFASAALARTARLYRRDELKLFVPGMMYGGTDHLTKSAVGGADSFSSGTWPALRIREDRMPAPLMGFIFPGGGYAAVIDPEPRGDTVIADTEDTQGRTVIDRRMQFGAIGVEPADGALVMGRWFPGVEGQVTYAGNTYPGGQLRKWRRRYHPIEDGLTQAYRAEYLFDAAPDFAAAYRDIWRAAWSALRPKVNPQDIEAARRSLLDMLAERAEAAPGGLTGMSNFIDPAAAKPDRKAVLGFTGKNLEAANHLLEDKGPQSAQHRATAIAIIESFTRLKMDPPVGEGFNLDTGAPVLAIPRDKVVYLRSFGDDMKAMLRAVAFERKNGREHPAWLAWVRSYADWLLTQQQPEGGFPRSWRPETGEVADPSPQSTYNAVPFLVMLTSLTGDAGYRQAAVRAAEFSWNKGQSSGVFVGGTIDNPDVIDKEAGTLSLEAFLALYESTHEDKWLQRARVAASYAETWMYLWNVPMPLDADNSRLHWKRGVPTTGLQLISSGHSLVDAYMAFDVDEYAKLYRFTGDTHYRDVARILLHNTKAMLAVPGRTYDLRGTGWQQEHWSLAPVRGFGLHRAWLPWVSTSHLNGIFELEAADPALFRKLSRQ